MEKLYKFSGKPFVELNKLQKEILKNLKNLIGKKLIYVKNDCVCSKNQSVLISETCRYGLEINYKLCKICGLIRQDPILDEESLKIFYRDFYRELYTGSNSKENIEKIFKNQFQSGKKYYQIITDILKKKDLQISNFKNVLEIGSSAGGILAYFLNKGHEVHAMDYDDKYLNYAYESGIKNIYRNINQIDKKFDLIILAHTFEHFKDLKKNINLINNLLNDKGLIFFDVPGIFNKDYYHVRNIIYDIKRTHFLYYLQNAHTYYFTKETFEYFLTKLGIFNIISINEKINCLVQKTEKTEIAQLDNFKYKKIINFMKINSLRYKILCFFRLIFYPLIKLLNRLKTT